jgi:hypothetical protein
MFITPQIVTVKGPQDQEGIKMQPKSNPIAENLKRPQQGSAGSAILTH